MRSRTAEEVVMTNIVRFCYLTLGYFALITLLVLIVIAAVAWQSVCSRKQDEFSRGQCQKTPVLLRKTSSALAQMATYGYFVSLVIMIAF